MGLVWLVVKRWTHHNPFPAVVGGTQTGTDVPLDENASNAGTLVRMNNTSSSSQPHLAPHHHHHRHHLSNTSTHQGGSIFGRIVQCAFDSNRCVDQHRFIDLHRRRHLCALPQRARLRGLSQGAHLQCGSTAV